jgi:hypothetical protein
MTTIDPDVRPWDVGWPGCRKAGQFLAVLGCYWVLSYADRAILAPVFGYQGLEYQAPSLWTQGTVIVLIIACTALTPARLRHPSDGVLYILLSLVVLPVLLVAATDVIFADVRDSLIASVTGAYLVLAACARIPRTPPCARAPRARRQPWILAAILSAASYGLMFATFGVHLRLPSFSDVYSVRSVFSDQAPGALGYLVDWQADVINPLLIAWGLYCRRWLLVFAGILGELLIYSVTGFKSVLFIVLAVAALLLAVRQENLRKAPATGTRIAFAFAALAAVAVAADTWRDGITWTSLLVQRMSLVVGTNTGYYFQYFATMPKTHLAYGTTGWLLGETPVTPPPAQIAAVAYHGSVLDPNANLWADAYANFGVVGVIAFTLLLAAFLWYYDRYARNANRAIATVLIAAPSLSLANGALLTCLLTHGMLLALLLAAWLPHDRRYVAPVLPPLPAGPLPRSLTPTIARRPGEDYSSSPSLRWTGMPSHR